jgi:Cytochrome c
LRTLQSFLLVGVVCAATAAILPGCGSTPASTSSEAGAPGAAGATSHAGAGGATGTAGAAAGGAPALVGDAARGKIAYNAPVVGAPTGTPGAVCYSCHGVMGEGMLGPNITFATGTALGSGIGGWTEQQFHDAVRKAVWKDGTPLCMFMVAVPATGVGSASDQDIADIYAYLMSVPPVTTPLQGSYCATGSPTGK